MRIFIEELTFPPFLIIFECGGWKNSLLKYARGRAFWCSVFGVGCYTSPQKDGADAYSHLIPPRFFSLLAGNCQLEKEKSIWEKGGGKGGWRVGDLLSLLNFYLETPSIFLSRISMTLLLEKLMALIKCTWKTLSFRWSLAQ